MGCDIHVHFEIQIDNKWEYYGIGDFERSYRFFSRLAGVRAYDKSVTPIAPNRGLPDDITLMTKQHVADWGIDGHSHSWISSKEYCELYDEFNSVINEVAAKLLNEDFYRVNFDNTPYLFNNAFHEFYTELPDVDWPPEHVQDFRMIFWFDN